MLGNKKVHAYYVPSRKKQAQFYERLAWDKASQWGKRQQRGSNRKNSGEWRELSGCLGRGKGWRSLETCLWCSRSVIPDSGIMLRLANVFMLTDSWCCWQYHVLSISHSYNSGKDFLKHGFWASNTNFFARLFTYLSALRRAKNVPVICCKKKKKHSKYGAFLTLFCNKLWSHLQGDWLINRRSKGTVL